MTTWIFRLAFGPRRRRRRRLDRELPDVRISTGWPSRPISMSGIVLFSSFAGSQKIRPGAGSTSPPVRRDMILREHDCADCPLNKRCGDTPIKSWLHAAFRVYDLSYI